jgi:hypothetical protein
MDFKYWFCRIFYKEKYQSHAQIEGKNFTLFYDYDQLRDGEKLSQLTYDGKIEWFRLRMEAVFLEPSRRIFNPKSVAHRELNSASSYDLPIRAAMIAAFSVLLNGIEALGSFMRLPRINGISRNERHFRAFVMKYMSDWDTNVSGTTYQTLYQTVYLPKILWKYFRNGIAHGFVIQGGGGIDYGTKGKKWKIENGRLEICPIAFFKDFEVGVKAFFADIENPQSSNRSSFRSRFRQLYPY